MQKSFSFTSCLRSATVVPLSVCSLWAFASMGGGEKSKKKQSSLLKQTNLVPFKPGMNPFSLKSGLQYRGSQVISQEKSGNTLMTRTVITYKNGNTVYIVPVQQKTIMRKFKTPTPAPRP